MFRGTKYLLYCGCDTKLTPLVCRPPETQAVVFVRIYRSSFNYRFSRRSSRNSVRSPSVRPSLRRPAPRSAYLTQLGTPRPTPSESGPFVPTPIIVVKIRPWGAPRWVWRNAVARSGYWVANEQMRDQEASVDPPSTRMFSSGRYVCLMEEPIASAIHSAAL